MCSSSNCVVFFHNLAQRRACGWAVLIQTINPVDSGGAAVVGD